MVNTTGLIERPSVLGPRCITCDARGHAVCGRECLSNKAVASFDRYVVLKSTDEVRRCDDIRSALA